MANSKDIKLAGRPVPGGPVAGALGFALLGAAVLGFWRRLRHR